VLNKGLSYRERTQRNFFFGEDTAEVETKPLRDLNNLPPLDGGPDAAPNFASERTLLDVVRYPHPSLRRENALIERFDARLEQLVDNLFLTLYNEGDGIGLAAPQVGVNLRVMVYNPRAMDRDPFGDKTDDEVIFINPRIIKESSQKVLMDESCLSFPRMKGPVYRPSWVEVEAVDFEGKPFQRRIDGFEARLFLHEYDHLDGVVYIDRLGEKALKRVEPDINFLINDYARSGRSDPAI